MRVENLEKTIKLDEELLVKIFLRRAGQESALYGDRIVVLGKILLPTVDEDNDNLDARITFGNRVQILNEYLHSRWGKSTGDKGFRSIGRLFAENTWKAAFQQAEESLTEELDKLIAVYSVRQSALTKAEE